MTRTLYIIGNGFDLHHHIPSSYKGFGAYLKANDQNTYQDVERYFGVDADFWADFEEMLASLDIDTLTDDASDFLVSYAAEDWSDANHHDYQFEISRVVKAISVTLRSRFAEWIRQLPIPALSAIDGVRLPVNSSAIFLNFNYTPSLQQLYGVPDANVLHIHGAANDPDARLILGHGWNPKVDPDPYRFAGDPEEVDVRVVEGQRIVDKYFRDTFKPTAQIIVDNAAFFASLSDVDSIFVMGHSVSEVDHPYFREVIRSIDADRVRWKISYFGDLAGPRARVEALGISAHLVAYVPLADF